MDFRYGDARDWFIERRFGLFIHWGLYAIDGWHEQEQYRRRLSRERYGELVQRFNPVKYDPDEWLDVAQQTGMEYLVFTTKHIDGFCLWDTKQTDYNVMHTPYRRDTLRMLADACHRRGVPLSLYYNVVSHHHPNYPNRGRPYEFDEPQPGDEPDTGKYLAFVKRQVEELCSNYGRLHGFWWDTGPIVGHGPEGAGPDPWYNETIRRLQPAAVINNRGFDTGDFDTPERDWYGYVRKVLVFERPTEACNSIGVESWGYRKDEDYYTPRYLTECVDRTLAKGGNFLLNVGPQGDGSFPAQARHILGSIGSWFGRVKESFYGAEPLSFVLEQDGILVDQEVLLTRKGNSLYVHMPSPLKASRVLLRPIAALPERAVVLNTGTQARCSVEMVPSLHRERKGYLRVFDLPTEQLAHEATVIRLDFTTFPLREDFIAERLAAYRREVETRKAQSAVAE